MTYYHLIEMGYAPMIHYVPIFLKYYKETFNYKIGDYLIVKNLQRCISLPLFPSMSDDEVYNVKSKKQFIKINIIDLW